MCAQVFTQVLRPGYGEVMVYEHELANPYSHETVRGGMLQCHHDDGPVSAQQTKHSNLHEAD
jgi:hypothetical protein